MAIDPDWKTTPKRAIIDGDTTVYAYAFAAQEKKPDGEIVTEPLHHCLGAVKASVKRLLEKFSAENNYSIHLTKGGSYRAELATIKPYKGNRAHLEKPVYYHEVREYLVNRWGAQIHEDVEADDVVAIEYNQDPANSILISEDKDLNQQGGFHFNPKKGFKLVNKQEAIWNLWHQVITGDRVDNIVGIPGVGEKKATKELLSKSLGAIREGELPSHRVGYDMALQIYTESLSKGSVAEKLKREDGTIPSPMEALHEHLSLVYLLRTPEEMENPKEAWRKLIN